MVRSRILLVLAAVAVVAATSASAQRSAPPAAKPAAAAGPVILIDTVKGPVEVELYPADAPQSVAKILDLIKTNFYRGQRIHHAQAGVVQFGDPISRNMQKLSEWGFGGSGKRVGVKETSKRSFDRGTVGFAYQADRKPEDADSQLFIIRIANPGINGKYALLGKVTKGMDVVDKLGMGDVIKNVTLKP
ncbi:MAG: peptidylprolyl isomerase [Acidobacteriota bacterium]